ncbi:MAG: helix-turn-helix transcriptional regulator [Victivallales bacterium]|nr:helix-turn-helix transcriptional regulator [Victivallales bacterium]
MTKKDLLDNVQIVRQRHPSLSSDMPFDLAWEYSRGAESVFRGDMHYALQMCIVIHGGMEVAYKDFSREYIPGETEWTMFWEPHAFRFTGERNFVLAINIDIDHLGNCDPFGEGNWLLPFVIPPHARFSPLDADGREFFRNGARRLFHLWTCRPVNWKLYSWFIIHEFILKATDGISCHDATFMQPEVTGKFRSIRPAVSLVRNTTGRPPSLAEAAASCNFSVSRFSHIFRETFGVSFGKFAARSRLASAARELKQNRHTIEDIATKWGFFDCSHFLHAFKSLYGCTPRQYQKRH